MAASLLCACGPSTTDESDEAGAPDADDTRVELIYVDSEPSAGDSTTATVTPPGPAHGAPADSLPPAPGPEDEAGGDDLLSYDADGAWAVQVGTFKTAASASRRVRQLSDLGYPAYAVTHPAGTQVRVRIGYFASRGEAERFGQRFRRDHGGTYWVDQRARATAAR